MNRRDDNINFMHETYRQKLRREFMRMWEHNRATILDLELTIGNSERREVASAELKRIENYLNHIRTMSRVTRNPLATVKIKPIPISVGTQTWATTRVPVLSRQTLANIKATKPTNPVKVTRFTPIEVHKPIRLTTASESTESGAVNTPNTIISATEELKKTTAGMFTTSSKVNTPNKEITPTEGPINSDATKAKKATKLIKVTTTASKFATPGNANTPNKVTVATEGPMNSKPNTGVKDSTGTNSVKTKSERSGTGGFNLVAKRGRYDYATTKRSVTPVSFTEPSEPFQ